ncbi:uncharacterized protein THITE_2042382 [Thermothielavioides terrestris NRRL 8126]|uniref:Uncharacterized protein n=1 Tax=Thermothielavioides terrestris (strain ATCC 38088 / NRRL 8126) TaxID=578455 RepID=G2QTE9_THETT|nr:uncharacterized protein THITE_2042382 [Thermothielavioides terrestris NRRL 8126]AEO63566.1 hypothetical protein THITE_2042382 [Thermothielavioides terrestris NRRL 8126]
MPPTLSPSPSPSPPVKRPKVILFDIGGVLTASPFQAILDYELRHGIPTGWINYSISRSAPSGFWQRLETGSIPLDEAFFAGFNRDLHDPARWKAFYLAHQQQQQQQQAQTSKPTQIPPMPQIDGKYLFHAMMSAARVPDPWMYPAARAVRASGQYLVAGLSNTVKFPAGHDGDRAQIPPFLTGLFDVLVSSAHEGLRKPDPRIYRLALERVDKFARAHAGSARGRALGWADGVAARDVVFLDDIGENLRAARAAGFRTIKVPLGRAYEAVEELERVTGLALAGDHPKIPVKPDLAGGAGKAKI